MTEWDEYQFEYESLQEWSEEDLDDKIELKLTDFYWEYIAPLEEQLKRLGHSPSKGGETPVFRPQINNGYFFKSRAEHKNPVNKKYGTFLTGLHDKLCDAGLMHLTETSQLDFNYAFDGLRGEHKYDLEWKEPLNLCPYLLDVLIDKRIIDGMTDYNKATTFMFGVKDPANLRNQYKQNKTGKPRNHKVIDDIIKDLL